MLDVGCGDGATTAFVQSHRQVEWAGGVEVFPDAAERAKVHFSEVWCGDVEKLDFDRKIPASSLDLILCLDILEHLVDPWTVVRRLSMLVAPRGRLIISVPNIRNWKFIAKLLFRGEFHYRDAGLLDRSHLRFFVKETAEELAAAGGIPLLWSGNAHPWKPGDMRALLSHVSFGRLDNVMIKQYIVVAEAPADRKRLAAISN
jgi:2-polyprenyl-3-methyl-5-hydroxy-6-metoxy-1,4-benzoquinol methylase